MNARRGQAATEYLVTYGWAFLVILVMLGSLSYFGLLNPSRFLPSQCDFGQQLECIDWEAKASSGSNDGEVNLFVRNNFGVDISITKFEITGATGLVDTATFGGISITPGATGQINVDSIDDGLLIEGEKQQLLIRLTFHRINPDGETHVLSGILYAEVRSP